MTTLRWCAAARPAGVTSQRTIDCVNEIHELLALVIARMRKIHRKISTNSRWIAAKDNNTVGQENGFVNVMCDYKNRARGKLVVKPKLQNFAAERLGSKYIERRKWLVHEKHFGLDHECTGNSNSLLHAA